MVMPMFSVGGMSSYGNMYQNIRARYSCGHIDAPNPHPVMARYPGEFVPVTKRQIIPESWLGRVIQKLYR